MSRKKWQNGSIRWYNSPDNYMAHKRNAVATRSRDLQTISIHSNVAAVLPQFLKNEAFRDREMADVVTLLIGLLSSYREEGHRLFPEVFFFDAVEDALKVLSNSERVAIGTGAKTPETITLAVKRCAPLAQWGWSVYLSRAGDNFEYGLLRCGLTSLSLSVFDLLVEQGDASLPVIAIRHVSPHTIEVSGARHNTLQINFAHVGRFWEEPVRVVDGFCERIGSQAPEELREQVCNFYRRVLGGTLKAGHGCLAAVLLGTKLGGRLPAKFKDGVVISPAIDVSGRIRILLQHGDCESDIQLRAIAALLRGMLSVDGITVFGPDGSVRAYNVFVKDVKRVGGGRQELGGARHRAYTWLCSCVGKELDSAFFLSQDGQAEFLGS